MEIGEDHLLLKGPILGETRSNLARLWRRVPSTVSWGRPNSQMTLQGDGVSLRSFSCTVYHPKSVKGQTGLSLKVVKTTHAF